MDTVKYILPEDRIPRAWYNIQADLPQPAPPVMHPGTGQPIGPDDLAPLFPMALIMQEVSQDREIEIPEEILSIYQLWRPSPLMRARRLEKVLDTLAAAYAEVGEFSKAVRTAQKALEIVSSQRQDEVVEVIRRHLQLFRAGRPCRERCGGSTSTASTWRLSACCFAAATARGKAAPK